MSLTSDAQLPLATTAVLCYSYARVERSSYYSYTSTHRAPTPTLVPVCCAVKPVRLELKQFYY